MFKLSIVVLCAALVSAMPTAVVPRAGAPGIYSIHPNGDNSKCVGIVGGVYANGTAVDIYDCDGSLSQKWQWEFDGTDYNHLTSYDDATFSRFCLDAGNVDQIANGVKMKIWSCFDNLPQQSWRRIETKGTIPLNIDNKCLDLTDGIKENRNVLQIWDCTAGNTNQIWSFTPA